MFGRRQNAIRERSEWKSPWAAGGRQHGPRNLLAEGHGLPQQGPQPGRRPVKVDPEADPEGGNAYSPASTQMTLMYGWRSSVIVSSTHPK